MRDLVLHNLRKAKRTSNEKTKNTRRSERPGKRRDAYLAEGLLLNRALRNMASAEAAQVPAGRKSADKSLGRRATATAASAAAVHKPAPRATFRGT